MGDHDAEGGGLGMLAWLSFDESVVGMGLPLVARIVKAGCGPVMTDFVPSLVPAFSAEI